MPQLPLPTLCTCYYNVYELIVSCCIPHSSRHKFLLNRICCWPGPICSVRSRHTRQHISFVRLIRWVVRERHIDRASHATMALVSEGLNWISTWDLRLLSSIITRIASCEWIAVYFRQPIIVAADEETPAGFIWERGWRENRINKISS